MSKPKILVVGSFVMDNIYTMPKFPVLGQTVLGTGFSTAPGGKGANQAVQCARLGAEVTMLGKLGCDATGDRMIEVMKENNIDVSLVTRTPDHPSAVANIQIEQNDEGSNNRIVVISGANMEIKDEDIACLKDTIKDYDMVIMQFEIPIDIDEKVAQMAHAAGVPVMVNPAPSAPISDVLIANTDILSPNETECADITGVTIRKDGKKPNLDDIKKATKVLFDKGCKSVLITLGNAGAAYCTCDGNIIHAPAVEGVVAVDPTAAGDSFIGAFCTYTAGGMPIEDALKKANYTAACTVTRMGAMPSLPTLQQVDDYIASKN